MVCTEMNNKKLLCILHRSPPKHGASKVGDDISSSSEIATKFDCRFVSIRSSDSISDIGTLKVSKIWRFLSVWFSVLFQIIIFRPNKIYFTASVGPVAFYRDIFLSLIWKVYSTFADVTVFYHYHTRGVSKLKSRTQMDGILLSFFLKEAVVITLGEELGREFANIGQYRRLCYLPNGVESICLNKNIYNGTLGFDSRRHVLYMSNMIKSKGYWDVLKLSLTYKDKGIVFHFAGSWQSEHDEVEFLEFVRSNNLTDVVCYHGFADDKKKTELFALSDLFVFPTFYPNEAFPLSILESLSAGVPVLSTNIGEIPNILTPECGILIDEISQLPDAFEDALARFSNVKNSVFCQDRYRENYTLGKFEQNFIAILGGEY